MDGDRSFLNRRRFVAVSVATLLAGCTGSETPSESASEGGDSDQSTTANSPDTPTQQHTKTPEEKAQQAKTTNVTVGEAVSGDDLSMVVRDVTKTKKIGQFQEAESGNTFVVVRLAAKNTSDKFRDFNSFLQTRLKDSENTVYDSSFGVTDHPIQSGILAPGEVARGDVVFEVPESVEGLIMQFDFSAFDLFKFERVTVDLTQEATSVANLEQSLDVDVSSTGEQVAHNDVTVTVHGVRTTTELGSFTKAEEGNEYVIPDIEITNDTSEELNVSTALQMRIKTGTGLAYTADIGGSSQLDKGYSEGSPIAPGESRRGELAYQVSQDDKPLYWVFDFLNIGDPYKAFWNLR